MVDEHKYFYQQQYVVTVLGMVNHCRLYSIPFISMKTEFEDTKRADRKSEDRQDHGQQNETKDKHTTLH